MINNQNDDYIKLADNDAGGVISINAGADNLVNGLNNGEDNSGTKMRQIIMQAMLVIHSRRRV